MITKVIKGGDMRGLLRYLQGPGKANEHTEPHVVAGDPYLMAMYSADVLDQEDAIDIAKYLDEPRRAYGTEISTTSYIQDPETGEKIKAGMRPAHVWHCAISLGPSDGAQGDERWQAIAQDFMDSMGFTEASGKAPARWVAVHHGTSENGNDHIHIAASAVREDGTKWDGLWRDWVKAQQTARELEQKYDLERLDGREFGTTERDVSFAERESSQRAGLAAPASRLLGSRVRATAVASTSEAEWVRRVRGDGMVIKPYFAKGTTDVVTGYRVALRPQDYRGKLVFFGGKRLGQDLSLPRLRERWGEPSVEQSEAASAEWQAAFRGRRVAMPEGRETMKVSAKAPTASAEQLAQFSDRLAQIPMTDRGAFADAARDVSGALSAWARFDPEHREDLRAAASTIARSAQTHRRTEPAGRRPVASTMGTALLFEQAKHGGKGKIAGAVFMQQILKTAEALRDFHQVSGNLREATRIQEHAVARLAKVPLLGYAPDVQRPVESTLRRQAPVDFAREFAQEAAKGNRSGAPAPASPVRPGPVASPLPRPLTRQPDSAETQRER